MKISTKYVTQIAVLTSGVALSLGGCVSDDEGLIPDPGQNAPTDGTLAEGDGSLPPIIVIPPGGPNDATPRPTQFARNLQAPSNLVAVGDSLYWVETDNNEIALKWMHSDGGDHHVVAELESLPYSTVADSAGLYFAASVQQELLFAPHVGLHAESFVLADSDPLSIQLSGDSAVWTESNGCVYRGLKEGGDAKELGCGSGTPLSLTLTENSAFWATTEGDLYMTRLDDGGSVDRLAEGQNFTSDVVADDSGVYWADASQREIRRYRFATDEVVVLASGEYAPATVAQDRFYLYFSTHSDGAIKRVLKVGGEVTKMTDGQEEPGQIVVSDEWLYWINEGDDTVIRLLKNYDY